MHINTATWTSMEWIEASRAPGRARFDNDRTLVREIQARGTDACFDRLVEKYKNKVYRLALSIMGPAFAVEAEDITQEVFIQVYRKIATFRQESGFSTWLFRITKNQALDRKRRARFRIPHHGDEALAGMAAPHESADPAFTMMKRQRKLAVLDALEKLEEPYRSVIHLHYWMNCSVQEIAGQMESRPGTVKSQLSRGRKRLADLLHGERHLCKEEDDG